MKTLFICKTLGLLLYIVYQGVEGATIMGCGRKAHDTKRPPSLFLTHQWEASSGSHQFVVDMVRRGAASSRKKRSRIRRKGIMQSLSSKRKIADKHVQKQPRGQRTKTSQEHAGNKLLDEFGIDLGPMGNEIYDWLWPRPNETSSKRNQKKLRYIRSGGYFPSTKNAVPPQGSQGKDNGNIHGHYNDHLHRHILHNYAQERLVEIYRRIAFHMRISPRILAREVAAVTGKFGINILQPDGDEYGSEMRPDVLCLRRIKAKVYCLLGLKLIKYHFLLLLRYIRLGIPPEIRERYISDILTRANISQACSMICSNEHTSTHLISQEDTLSARQESPLKLTYPDRVDFHSQGYPYSTTVFCDHRSNGWSPSQLVLPSIFERLSDKSKCKLVYVAASLHPEYCLQLIKNIAFCAGYTCERELLQKFCIHSRFGSRGAKAFVSKLKEEWISSLYIQKAARLASGSTTFPNIADALKILANLPLVSGLTRRHIDSGHKIMPIKTARMIFKRIRNNVTLRPEDMMLWDVAREAISRRIPKAPLVLYRQVRMELFAAETYIAPTFRLSLTRRGIDTTGLYDLTSGLSNDPSGMDYTTKRRIAKQISKNLKKIWLRNAKSLRCDMERIGLDIVDAMAATAGYESFNNILVLVTMLSETCDDVKSWRCQQPGPDFEHSTRLEIKDFKYKINNTSFQ